jgi:outer membrane lipase/esterase
LSKFCFKKRLIAAFFCAAVLSLISCGGSTQSERFVPQRILVLGDESSVIDDSASAGNGRKHTVNALAADNTTLDCTANPLWVQVLAGDYSLVLPPCNPGIASAPASRVYASAQAKVADVTAQIDRHLSADNFTSRDLVTVWVGMHDVLSQYRQYPGVAEAQLMTNVAAAGSALAAQINRISAKGSKVLVITVPELGYTPYARAEALAHPATPFETHRAALLNTLTAQFNTAMRTQIVNDGHSIGLVLADEKTLALVKDPSTESFVNVTDQLCDPALSASAPACTTQTLRSTTSTPALTPNGGATNYLWASDLHLSPGAHRLIGLLASTRAGGNPF